MRIDTKERFYDLYYKGALGNTIRQWDHAEYKHLLDAGKLPRDITGYAVRVKSPDHSYMRYELTDREALDYGLWLHRDKRLPLELLNYSELAPDHRLTLQGEFGRMSYGRPPIAGKFRTRFGSDPASNRMRVSMDLAEPLDGLAAWDLVCRHMDATSLDFVNGLLDDYPDAVIEFACYDCPVGVLRWNTIIWEVRNY